MNGRLLGLAGIALAMVAVLAVLGAGRPAAAMELTPAPAPSSTPIATATFFSEIGDEPAVHTPPLTATPAVTAIEEVLGLTAFPGAGAGGPGAAPQYMALLVVLTCAGASLLASGLALSRTREPRR